MPKLTASDLALVKTETLRLTGTVGAVQFAPWIRTHAHKLGLGLRFLRQVPDQIELELRGQPALIDAMRWPAALDRRKSGWKTCSGIGCHSGRKVGLAGVGTVAECTLNEC